MDCSFTNEDESKTTDCSFWRSRTSAIKLRPLRKSLCPAAVIKDFQKKMHDMKNLGYLLIFFSLVVNSSCLNRQFVDEKAEFVSISDASPNDSIEIFGYVNRVGSKGNHAHYENEFVVWLENSGLNAMTDTSCFYSIKTTCGTYLMKCQSSSNKYERLIVEFDTGEILNNKKMQVNFYVGYTIE